MAAGDVDDRQPAMPEPEARLDMEAVAVRTAMREGVRHGPDDPLVDRRLAVRLEDACQAAHAATPEPS